MRHFAPVGAGFLMGVSALLYAAQLCTADDQPKKAQVEPMSQDRFSEIHAPLFQPPKSQDAGALTDRIAASLPGGKLVSAPVPRRNFIDDQIFGKMEPDRIPHSPLTSNNQFLPPLPLALPAPIP